MSNHPFKTDEEWERIESPLCALDEALAAYAAANELSFSKNFKFWPERSLSWQDKLTRQIQVILQDEENLLYNVWVAAYEDRPDGRYWMRKSLADALPVSEIAERLESFLDEGLAVAMSWSADELIRGHV